MTEISDDLILAPDDEAVDGLKKMTDSGFRRLPVIHNSKLVGILTRRDVMDLLKIKTDLG